MNTDCSTDSSSSIDEQRRKKTGAYYEVNKSNPIMNRPNASPGYWLCCLLPLALGVSYCKLQYTTSNFQCYNSSSLEDYRMLTIAALGMSIESICFFMYIVNTGLLTKLIISLLPGVLTTLLYSCMAQHSLSTSFFWGFAITFCYQNVYIRVMRGLPQCFSYGEACILVQGVMLFFVNCVLQLPKLFLKERVQINEFNQLNDIMMSALFCLLCTCCLLATFKVLRKVYGFYLLMFVLLLAVTALPITRPLPIVLLFQYMFRDIRRIYIVLFYLALVAATVGAIAFQLRKNTQNTQKASTRMRKIFHVFIVLVYVPGLLYQCTFLYIASGVALAIFAVLELFRIFKIPPLHGVLKSAFATFSDEKDAGALALTPFCLLIGISLPLWISPCLCNKKDTAIGANLLSLMSGILTIGVGDTAASVIGSKYGTLKWKNSSRSLQGTFAYIATVTVMVYGLCICGFAYITTIQFFLIAAAIFVSALVEAHTDQIDNLVLPLVFYIIASY